MARFGVELPIAGYAYVEVEAEDEAAAVDAALASEIKTSDIQEWDVFKALVRGNVCYAPRTRPEVFPMDDDEI